MTDVIILMILIILIGAAVSYIVKEKKTEPGASAVLREGTAQAVERYRKRNCPVR